MKMKKGFFFVFLCSFFYFLAACKRLLAVLNVIINNIMIIYAQFLTAFGIMQGGDGHGWKLIIVYDGCSCGESSALDDASLLLYFDLKGKQLMLICNELTKCHQMIIKPRRWVAIKKGRFPFSSLPMYDFFSTFGMDKNEWHVLQANEKSKV